MSYNNVWALKIQLQEHLIKVLSWNNLKKIKRVDTCWNTGEGTSKNPKLLLEDQAWNSDGTNTLEHPRPPGNSWRSWYMITFSQNRDDQDLLWNVCEFFKKSRCCRTQPVRASQPDPTAGSVWTWQRDLLRLSLSQSWLDEVVDGAHIRRPAGWNPDCSSDRSAENVRSQSGPQSHGALQWTIGGRAGPSNENKRLEF